MSAFAAIDVVCFCVNQVLHLKRFEMDYNTMRHYKLNDECSFPETLDMEPFTVRALSRSCPPLKLPLAPVSQFLPPLKVRVFAAIATPLWSE
jgi:hypothetical protein